MHQYWKAVLAVVGKVGKYFLLSLGAFLFSMLLTSVLGHINYIAGVVTSIVGLPATLIAWNIQQNKMNHNGQWLVISSADAYHLVSLLIYVFLLVVSMLTHKPGNGFFDFGTALEEVLIPIFLLEALIYLLYVLVKFFILRKRAKKEKAAAVFEERNEE